MGQEERRIAAQADPRTMVRADLATTVPEGTPTRDPEGQATPVQADLDMMAPVARIIGDPAALPTMDQAGLATRVQVDPAIPVQGAATRVPRLASGQLEMRGI